MTDLDKDSFMNKEIARRARAKSEKHDIADDLAGLEYGDAVYSILSMLFEPWMEENDKSEIIALTLAAIGKTTQDLDKEIATGVANGYTVESQVDLCRKLFSSEDDVEKSAA